MNAKSDKFIIKGKIKQTLPARSYLVELENKTSIICHLSGRMRQNKISILVGDVVDVEMSLYDLSRGRIVYRYIGQ